MLCCEVLLVNAALVITILTGILLYLTTYKKNNTGFQNFQNFQTGISGIGGGV